MNIMLKTIEGLYRASRRFPYLEQLIIVFPFYAILTVNGFINSSYSLLLILPFIGAMTAGFMYNTICDTDIDPIEKNPIKRGDISKKTTSIVMVLTIIASILLFILFYKSYLAIILFLIYIFLWMAYSGLKIRFKESFLGPLIASIVGSVGAPFIILVEFNYFNYSSNLLLIGLFIISLAHEIKHTVVDYDADKSHNCKTFAILFSKRYSILTEYLLLIIGLVLILESSYSIGNSYIFNIVFILLFSISMILTVSNGLKTNFNINEVLYTAMPYLLTRIFFIIYACLIFNLPVLLILFIIWILDPRSI
jgi:4-hydroxybenzoate polyprenyltransferase